MKTYETILNLKNGETVELGNSPIGGCKVRRTAKGSIATNSNGNWYVKEQDFVNCFGNLNAIGLQSLEYAVKSPRGA